MSRIRSIHPGLWTDEAFATLSDAAGLLLLALGTEADDQGVFPWKPAVLRMRLRPAKDGDIEPLLEELLKAGWLKRFSAEGRAYGAIRNFRRHQRPREPVTHHPLPPRLAAFVGLGDHAPARRDNPKDPRAAERKRRQRARERDAVTVTDASRDMSRGHAAASRQMEDGEGEGRKVGDSPDCFVAWYAAYPRHVGRVQAERAYRRALRDTSPEALLLAAQGAARHYAGTEAKYIPHPATWLNGRRWEDEPPASPPTPIDAVEAEAYRGLD